ncbi:MAG: InlB B-repeat-containing protein [Bacilli bacterium]|nr:InlB B-repeat-containing protein [Bacilli bacterium]
MKKASAKLLQVLIMFFLLLAITGCRYDPYKDEVNVVVETDYFYVQLVRNEVEPFARILELTELGKEQEILVIPDKVEGLTVTQIGFKQWPKTFFGIDSTNLKKVYVPVTVENILENTFYECTNLEEFVVLSVPKKPGNVTTISSANVQVKVIFSDPLQENKIIVTSGSGGFNILVNLVFHYNYTDAPNSGIYWFDYITGSNLYRLPVDPIKTDTTFTGWYIDEECSIEWDEELPSSENEIIELYAGWE